jgi:hypothetical protein
VTALRKGGRNSGDSVAARSPARTNTLLHTSADNSGAGSPGSTKVEKEKSKMEKLEMMDSRFRHAGMTKEESTFGLNRRSSAVKSLFVFLNPLLALFAPVSDFFFAFFAALREGNNRFKVQGSNLKGFRVSSFRFQVERGFSEAAGSQFRMQAGKCENKDRKSV